MLKDLDIGLKDAKVKWVGYMFHDRTIYESIEEPEYTKTLVICHIKTKLYKLKDSDIEYLAKTIGVSSDYYAFRAESVNTILEKY